MEAKPQPTKSSQANSMFGPFMAFAVLYAFILFVATMAISSTPMAAVPLIACIGATIFLVAAWSVFGCDGYLKRLAMAHLFGAIPAAGVAIGLLLLTFGEGVPVESWSDMFFVALIAMLTLVPISVGAQIPFWFFRSLFGWQFARKGNAPVASFSLRDIFVITFLFAACFGAAQIAANIQMHQFGLMVSNTDYVPVTDQNGDPVLDADGFPAYENVELKGEELKQHRRRGAYGMQNRSFLMFGMTILVALVVSTLSIPILTSAFYSKDLGHGCLLTGLYVLAGIVLFIGIGAALGGARAMFVEVFFWVGVTMLCYALAVWLPLMTVREQNIALTSPNRFDRESRQASVVVKNDGVKEAAATTDESPDDHEIYDR